MSEVVGNRRLTKSCRSHLSLSFLVVTRRLPFIWRLLTPALGALFEYRDLIGHLVISGVVWGGEVSIFVTTPCYNTSAVTRIITGDLLIRQEIRRVSTTKASFPGDELTAQVIGSYGNHPSGVQDMAA